MQTCASPWQSMKGRDPLIAGRVDRDDSNNTTTTISQYRSHLQVTRYPTLQRGGFLCLLLSLSLLSQFVFVVVFEGLFELLQSPAHPPGSETSKIAMGKARALALAPRLLLPVVTGELSAIMRIRYPLYACDHA